jgi:hypothetical protein
MKGSGQAGKGLKEIAKGLSKVNNFLKKNKVISKGGKILGDFGVPYAADVGKVAGNLGYGRRKPRTRKVKF